MWVDSQSVFDFSFTLISIHLLKIMGKWGFNRYYNSSFITTYYLFHLLFCYVRCSLFLFLLDFVWLYDCKQCKCFLELPAFILWLIMFSLGLYFMFLMVVSAVAGSQHIFNDCLKFLEFERFLSLPFSWTHKWRRRQKMHTHTHTHTQ